MALVAALSWTLMIMLPLNYFTFMAARRERVRTGRIAREIWRLRTRR